ncbi:MULTISPECIES: DUF2934 domain-containing protein [Rhizobium]|uniref:DUF2934 domain-containing protein n=1 Tax=Rhizobium lentis TaxID=1138194 RepID=A0A7W8XEL0_9HYPH|nr:MULTISPECIES: DUF2934 domain-containing protein [Rhizobium]MBB4574932.1 hypothetical protein [Rhizobium lentis]MBB5550859.1 hypothetical protein [Rhizobium lentis]MBB5561019.1 hypothetical protein [Rhizobium lentis]MBB5567978.1 hypothetical protein [Rhizobium lentis]MEB3044953.1 DUF2934 domain-containing protein [Rhizobium sp. MJ21]
MKNPLRRKRNEIATDDTRLKASPPAGAGKGKTARRAIQEPAEQSIGSQPATREDEIRKRAYSLWEKEGRPEGKHRDHWIRAEHELDARGENNPPRLEALREASREHRDTFLVKTDLEDADQREASPGTREQD